MKKIICFVGSMDAGGAETFLMKIYRAIDKNKYQFDFIVNVQEKGFYDDEIKRMGGHIYRTPPKSKNLFSNVYQDYKIVKKGNYDAALRMTSHSLGTIDLVVAKIAGVRRLVLRSTNADSNGGKCYLFLHKLFSFLPKYIPNVKIAPSKLAAEYLFGKDCLDDGSVKILHNGLPLEIYAFSEGKRRTKRKELSLEGKFVLGHVGRFTLQKNHEFLIDIFYDVYKSNKDARLVLIGKGELEEKIKDKVDKLNISDVVKFLGVRNDISELLMAMDVFVFPSFFEGMPNVVIEAQATGLQSIISNTITVEAKVTDRVSFIGLSEKRKWVSAVNYIYKNESYDRNHYTNAMETYNIKDTINSFIEYIF